MENYTDHFHRPKLDLVRIPAVMHAKWGLPLLAEGYVPMPKMLLRAATKLFSKETAQCDLVTLLSIADCMTKYRKPISYRYIAFIAGLSEDEVEESVARLVKQDLLVFEPEENHRFMPKFTGLLEKVDEINREFDIQHQKENELFPDQEESSPL